MLAFVTSLRHPLNSTDYTRIESLLAESLASVCAQTSQDFAVFVVGNRRPTAALPPKVTFVEVDFPPPVPTAGPRFDLGPFVWDKGTKIGIGLAAARQVEPDHVMIFDADDFVHRDLAAFSADRVEANGWFVDEGYVYSRTRQSYLLERRFFGVCGTSHIVRWQAYDVPDGLTVEADQSEVSEAFGERLPAILGAHRNARTWLSKHGHKLAPLPFPGSVYQVDTGENHSGKQLRGAARPLDRTLMDQFGVPRLRPRAVAAWRAWEPRELVYSVRHRDRRSVVAST